MVLPAYKIPVVSEEVISEDRAVLQNTPNLLQEVKRRKINADEYLTFLKQGLSKGFTTEEWIAELAGTGQCFSARKLQRLLPPSGAPRIDIRAIISRKEFEYEQRISEAKNRLLRNREMLDAQFIQDIQSFLDDAQALVDEEWFSLAEETIVTVQRLMDQELAQATDERLEQFKKAQAIIQETLQEYVYAEPILRLENTEDTFWELVLFANQASLDMEGKIETVDQICDMMKQLYQKAPVNPELIAHFRQKYGWWSEKGVEPAPASAQPAHDEEAAQDWYKLSPDESALLERATDSLSGIIHKDLMRVKTPTQYPWNEEVAEKQAWTARVIMATYGSGRISDEISMLEIVRYLLRYWSDRKKIPDEKQVFATIREGLAGFALLRGTRLLREIHIEAACEYYRAAFRLFAQDEYFSANSLPYMFNYFSSYIGRGESNRAKEANKLEQRDFHNPILMLHEAFTEALSVGKEKRATGNLQGLVKLAAQDDWLLDISKKALENSLDENYANWLDSAFSNLEKVMAQPKSSEPYGARLEHLVAKYLENRELMDSSLSSFWISSQNRKTITEMSEYLKQLQSPLFLLEPVEVEMLRGIKHINDQLQHYFDNDLDFQERKDIAVGLVKDQIPRYMILVENNPTWMGIQYVKPILENIQSILEEEMSSLHQVSVPVMAVDVQQSEWRSDGHYYCHIRIQNLGETRAEDVTFYIDEPNFHQYEVVDRERKLGTLQPGKPWMFHMRLKPTLLQKDQTEFAVSARVTYRIPHRDSLESRVERLRVDNYSEERNYGGTIENPYVVGGPLLNDKMFYGRKELIQELLDEVANRERTGSVVIYGQKRSGKTSVLKQLEKRVPPFIVPVYFDCGSDIASIPNTLGNYSPLDMNRIREEALGRFLLAIADEIVMVWELRGMEVSPITWNEIMEKPGPDRQFRKFLEQFRNRPDGLRLLLLLDEFTGLMQKIDENVIDEAIMRMFKSLIEGGYLSCIVCGLTEVYSAVQRFANQLAVSKPQLVDYLTTSAARDLVNEPIVLNDGSSRYSPTEIINEVVDWTAGNPYYIQIFCQRLVSYMNQNKIDRVTAADLDLVRNSLVSGEHRINPDQQFDNLFRYKDNVVVDRDAVLEGLVIYALANETMSKSYATFANLHSHFKEFVSEDELTKTLNQLEQRGTIILQMNDVARRPDDQQISSRAYRIRVDLFKQWILANRPLDLEAINSFRDKLQATGG